MSEGEALGADFRGALESIKVPSYVLDRTGVVRWVNPAAVELVGDVRGRHFTSIVAPEETQRTRELLASKIIGAVAVTETEGVLLRADRSRVALKISAVPLKNGDRIVGVFGQLVGERREPRAAPHPDLTPRQAEVLRLLEHGRSTRQIADALNLSTKTVGSHVEGLLHAMGVHTRLEAVAAARRGARTTE